MKADLLRARDMKRYINQLTVAKKQCEKRIRLFGGPNYENNEEGGTDDSDEPQSQRVRREQCVVVINSRKEARGTLIVSLLHL